MLSELKILQTAVVRVGLVFVVLLVLLFSVPIPYISNTFAVFAIHHIQSFIVPEGVTLIVMTPLEAFSTQISLAAQLALFFVMPLLLFEAYRFVAPALYKHERRALVTFCIAGFFLMILGALFAYIVVLPSVFKGLFSFSPEGIVPFYTLKQVVSLVVGSCIAASILFLLPVAMLLLSKLGLVKPSFWATYARHAILLSFIFSAIIIPDPTGVAMVLLAVPLCLLYLLGLVGAKKVYNY